MSPPDPARCPSCGFRYAWDGRACHHCHHPIPTRDAWAGFDRMREQVERYHTDPEPAGLAWFAVACLRRVEHLIRPHQRSWPERIEDHLARPDSPLPEELINRTYCDVLRRGPPDADDVVIEAVIELTSHLLGHRPVTPNILSTVCRHARLAVGLAEFPHQPPDSLPLPEDLERYRTAVLAALAADAPIRPPGQPPRGHRLGQLRAYHIVRAEVDRYEAQRRPLERAEGTAQCALYRCVFGYPFEPVEFAPAWRTPTTVALAEAIFADRAFDRLPVLADALEEAGCDDADVLSHCRGGGPHVRGCWVVEQLRTTPDGG